MKQKNIYERISVDDELPTKEQEYFVIKSIAGNSLYHTSHFINKKFDSATITHWLKPTEKYVFTKEELEKLISHAFDATELLFKPTLINKII